MSTIFAAILDFSKILFLTNIGGSFIENIRKHVFRASNKNKVKIRVEKKKLEHILSKIYSHWFSTMTQPPENYTSNVYLSESLGYYFINSYGIGLSVAISRILSHFCQTTTSWAFVKKKLARYDCLKFFFLFWNIGTGPFKLFLFCAKYIQT